MMKLMPSFYRNFFQRRREERVKERPLLSESLEELGLHRKKLRAVFYIFMIPFYWMGDVLAILVVRLRMFFLRVYLLTFSLLPQVSS